jgi:predicted CXXCH cytochrome family protein
MSLRPLVCLAVLGATSAIACSPSTPPRQATKTFVGSHACRDCHQSLYDRWQITLMANVVQDPKQHPKAIVGDFSTPNPLVTFKPEDVDFTYGTKWKQRYWKKQGDDYFVLPAQWDVRNKVWRPYHVQPGTDWWVQYYPPAQEARPTGPLCDGCHSVNYDIKTHAVTEWNVGCERCHGAGGAHVARPAKSNIINPARLDDVRSNDVCIQCHSQGRPRANPIDGRYYDWAVGYQPGDRLSATWDLEEHRLGENTFTHWPDGSAHKNRMQGNDFVQSTMYHREIRCSDCHEVHSNQNVASLVAKGNEVCLKCHEASAENAAGLRGTVAAHTHHAENSAGSQCVACHMPKIAQTIKDNYVGSHTFRFISPVLTQQTGIPNPCTSCHTGKSNEWALKELKGWRTTSPWRVAGFGTDAAVKP